MPEIEESPGLEYIDGRIEAKAVPTTEAQHDRRRALLSHSIGSRSRADWDGDGRAPPHVRRPFDPADVSFLLAENLAHRPRRHPVGSDPPSPPTSTSRSSRPSSRVPKSREKLIHSTANGCPLGLLIHPERQDDRRLPPRPPARAPAPTTAPSTARRCCRASSCRSPRSSAGWCVRLSDAARSRPRHEPRPTATRPKLRLIVRRGHDPRRGAARGRHPRHPRPAARPAHGPVPRRGDLVSRRSSTTCASKAIPYTDAARAYEPTPWSIRIDKPAFPHQTEGLAAWWAGGRPGRGRPADRARARPTWPTSASRRPAGPRWSSRRRSTC